MASFLALISSAILRASATEAFLACSFSASACTIQTYLMLTLCLLLSAKMVDTYLACRTWSTPWALWQSHQTPFASRTVAQDSVSGAQGCISGRALHLWVAHISQTLDRQLWWQCPCKHALSVGPSFRVERVYTWKKRLTPLPSLSIATNWRVSWPLLTNSR